MKNGKLISLVEFITLLIITLFLLIFINLDTFIRFLSGKDSVTYSLFYQKIGDFIKIPLDWLGNHLLTPSVTTFILWAVIGVVCYVIVYFFIDLKKEVSETIKTESSFIHPNHHEKLPYNLLVAKSVAVLVFTVFCYALLAIASFRYFIPYSSTNLYLALNEHASVLKDLEYLLLSYSTILIILVTVLTIYRVTHELRTKISI